jgi:cell fate (sporulation/competence/biofilm development) regulator YlbF (YheA/YmcA/DUF963 family)
MTNVEYETKVLIREIKKSNEYNQYQRLKKKLSSNQDLMQAVNHYRKQCFYLQSFDAEVDEADQLAKLRDENYEMLSDASVHEFLLSEQKLCRMMQKILDSVTEAANLDLNFLQ